ncbi:hypothetical protein D3C86_1552980 [compost metagenome]
MVSVRMRFHNPLDLQRMLPHEGDDLVGTCRRGPPRFGVIVQDRVDDGALGAPRLIDHVGHGPGRGVEEWLNGGLHAGLLGCNTFYSQTLYYSI